MGENPVETLFLESSNDELPAHEDDHDSSFKQRESILTTHFSSLTDHRAAYNWISAHFIAYLLLHCVNYVLNPQDWYSDTEFLQKVFHHFNIALGLEIFLLLWSSLQWFLKTKSIMYPCTGIVSWIIFIVIPILVRVAMKMCSFLVETGKNGKDQSATFSQFIYFWFAPTLLYRSSYPRTKNRSWLRCLVHFIEFFACCFVLGSFFCRTILDGIGNPKNHPLRIDDLPKTLIQIMLIATCSLLVSWYGFMHCWLNGWAEALQFGDRFFYGSWWLCRSSIVYFRLWNRVIHEWLKRYIYSPIREKFGPKFAAILTLIVSAIGHEYFVSYALGGFMPLISLMYVGMCPALLFQSKTSTKNEESRFNSSLLFGKTIGWIMMITLFGLEGYSRNNCPASDQNHPLWNFFVPRLFTCIEFRE
ncbi:sterol O-acyltransferase 1-like isoform X2 [Brevipalpus obovatus]|uniref:sterol O-acyltransferase 1-like isoform X2 n=1 Tax=Brevipalpus obovatus TaxID=246614 RepID=UPI003D9DC6F5